MAVVSLAFAAGTPTVAFAAGPNETRARAAFKSAQRHYDLGEFAAALDGYAEAYRLNPLPAFLFNMAQCHRQLGNFERAAFFYSRFVDAAPPESPNVKLAQGLLKDMQEKVAANSNSKKGTPDVPRSDEYQPYTPSTTSAPPLPSSDDRAPAVPADAVSTSAPLAPAPQNDSVFKKWWFWTAVGVVAAGVTVTVIVTAPKPYPATLADISNR